MSKDNPSSLSVHQWVEISVGDRSMPVFVCTPSHGKPKAAVLVIQEIFGVNSHIRSVCERIAAEGYLALAPDLFHRQGVRFHGEYGDLPTALQRAQKLSEEQALQDIDRVIANLDEGLKIAVMGFCMGGRIAFQVAFNPRLSAAVTFYGTRIAEKALRWTQQIQCPLLMFFGGQDGNIPTDEIDKIRHTLGEHGKAHEIFVYPDAGHGFFCEERGSYERDSALDAWNRTLGFLAKKTS
jgi:carboxymethylenebutenolidase